MTRRCAGLRDSMLIAALPLSPLPVSALPVSALPVSVLPVSALLLSALLLSTLPLGAQSLFNGAGLGFPTEAIGGRGRALGNLGIGLWGHALLPSDPGAAGMLVIPSAVLVGQPSWIDYQRGAGDSGTLQGNRFPLLGIGYPLFSGMFTANFGSFLDQRFQGQRDVTVDLVDGPAEATDFFEQDGAVSNVNFGYSKRVRENLGLGLTVGRYAGSMTRLLIRDFGVAGESEGLDVFRTGGRWSYSGASVTGGFAADLGALARVAGSVTWSGALEATASEGTEGSDGSFDLPLQYRLGTSVVLASGLLVTASLARADWAEIGDDLNTPTTVGTTNGFGFGVELSRARVLGLTAPLRFGYRKSHLPFSFGGSSATETALAGGFGFVLNETDDLVLAGADFAIEKGERSDSSLKETFWRVTLSLRVSGY